MIQKLTWWDKFTGVTFKSINRDCLNQEIFIKHGATFTGSYIYGDTYVQHISESFDCEFFIKDLAKHNLPEPILHGILDMYKKYKSAIKLGNKLAKEREKEILKVLKNEN